MHATNIMNANMKLYVQDRINFQYLPYIGSIRSYAAHAIFFNSWINFKLIKMRNIFFYLFNNNKNISTQKQEQEK